MAQEIDFNDTWINDSETVFDVDHNGHSYINLLINAYDSFYRNVLMRCELSLNYLKEENTLIYIYVDWYNKNKHKMRMTIDTIDTYESYDVPIYLEEWNDFISIHSRRLLSRKH